MTQVPRFLNYDEKDPRFNNAYCLWGGKTQGEPYHMHLLAIACLLEARLGEKAFVYGNITHGQCQCAVELANRYLDRPIAVPACCDAKRFRERVSKLPLPENEQLVLFTSLYLGAKDAAFGAFVRNAFSADACDSYWRGRFSSFQVDNLGFGEALKEYLLWGFDLTPLCGMIDRSCQDTFAYERFVERVMEAKLHIRDKDTTDPMEIDPDAPQPYGLGSLFAETLLAGAKNRAVDRYIPLEEIRAALREGLRGCCDTDCVIDDWLARRVTKLTPSKQLAETIAEFERQCSEEHETYDVTDYDELDGYKSGDAMPDWLRRNIDKYFRFYHGLIKEARFAELMAATPKERCAYLAEKNSMLLLRDTDWEKIFDEVNARADAFRRYYPMVRADCSRQQAYFLVRALVLNDDLYNGCLAAYEAQENRQS